MQKEELLASGAAVIAELVRTKVVSADEIARVFIDEIEAQEPKIGAFLHFDPEMVTDTARKIDDKIARGEAVGRLTGVPLALKDNLATAGMPTTCASRILQRWQPPYNATVVDKINAEDALVLGKTNMDEFAMGSSTESSAFQVTRNPRDLSRVPGGSSGGSAASVAATMATLAVGSDTGGSIRQPAALCGVVGVKPTYGYVSRFGLIAFASSLDQIGPFGNSVMDAAILLEVMGGHDVRDSTSIIGERPTLIDKEKLGVKGIRVGVISELMDNIADDVRSRTQEAVEDLVKAGAKVGEVSAKSALLGLSAYYVIAPAEASSNLARYDGVRFGMRKQASSLTEMFLDTRSNGFGDEVKRRIMLGTYALSSGYYEEYYAKAIQTKRAIRTQFEELYNDFDVLLSPTSPTTAFRVGEKLEDPLAMYMNDVCTIPSNLAGHPAMSVPYGNGQDNLPVGVQIMAPYMGEAVMFQVAFELERRAQERFGVKNGK